MITADSNHDSTGRFINAVERAKSALERQYKREFKGLGQAVKFALEKRDRVVKSHASALNLLTELRNVIQHNNFKYGVPVAIPREDAVVAMEEIARHIERQPQIKDHMIKDLVVLTSESSLQDAAAEVIRLDLSQIPVYNGSEYVGLFTTNAMARWLSKSLEANAGVLIEESVEVVQILDCSEDHERPLFVKPTEPALKACDTLSNESSPSALLVTTDGTSRGALQGIVTRFDVPRILKAITVKYP